MDGCDPGHDICYHLSTVHRRPYIGYHRNTNDNIQQGWHTLNHYLCVNCCPLIIHTTIKHSLCNENPFSLNMLSHVRNVLLRELVNNDLDNQYN